MMQNNKYPSLIIHKGKGTFSSENFDFEADFEITHYPQNTIIIAKTDTSFNIIEFLKVFTSQKLWKLNGICGDNIPVIAYDLICTNSTNLTFMPLNKGLKLGNISSKKLTHAEFPLVGLYDGQLNINHYDWQLSTTLALDEPHLVKTKSELWNLPLEGNTLILRNSRGASIEDFQILANNISLLLSLALGNSVIFNRQLFYNNDEFKVEIWRRKPDYHFGSRQCIPIFELNNYIEKSLSIFEQWSKEKKDTYYSVVNYINSSSKGFLEDRLLRICIAWESLANKWFPKEQVSNSKRDLDPLKIHLKSVIEKFELPDNYDKNFIKGRISTALNWERLLSSIMKLIDHYNLDHNKLNLDIGNLIKIRNDVAHSGRFRTKYSKKYLADLIFYNKTALSVLLLTDLGYKGLIEFKKDNWKTLNKIDEFYKINTQPLT